MNEARQTGVLWEKWGPHLSERQWGTVRGDYSQDGNAQDYFSHDQSRSRAYRWEEDGIAGISDDKQQLCFAIALWNGRLHTLLRVFHGDNGAGLGASHQAGWTGIIARILDMFARGNAADSLQASEG